MKKKPYILPKLKAIDVADPIANFHRDEDERKLWELIEESMKMISKENLTNFLLLNLKSDNVIEKYNYEVESQNINNNILGYGDVEIFKSNRKMINRKITRIDDKKMLVEYEFDAIYKR